MDVEFSRMHDLTGLEAETSVTLTADEAECRALCERFGLEALSDFSARVTIRPWRRRTGVRLNGTVSGQTRQICVVTLEPFDAPVESEFEELFSYDAPESFAHEMDEADLPTALDGPILDIGEVVAEHFALALDPYPKKPGVAFEMPGEEPEDDRPESPFAVLRALKTPEEPE